MLKAFFASIVLTVCPAVWAAIEFPIPDSVQSWEIPEMATNGVKAVWIEGVPWFGKPTRFFAYYSLPEGAVAEKKVPGIVLVHGGWGTASHSWVKLWNARGYAAIAMDNCGGIPGEKSPMPEHPRHKWSGPNGWGRFSEEKLNPGDQWVYHAVESVIRAHTFLRSLPEVSPICVRRACVRMREPATPFPLVVRNRRTVGIAVESSRLHSPLPHPDALVHRHERPLLSARFVCGNRSGLGESGFLNQAPHGARWSAVRRSA